MTIKVSYIIPVLNSHSIVARQLSFWDQMPIPEGVEIILVDDGSTPPIVVDANHHAYPIRVIATNDFRPWTWALARNAGAKLARGSYLLMTDLDYIVPLAALQACLKFTGDKLRFKREFGVLDERGVLRNNPDTLIRYGLPEERYIKRGTKMPPHPNNFCIRKQLFWEMGGYREDLVDRPYPQGEDRHFKRTWIEFCNKGMAKESDVDDRPTIFMFPNGQFCGDVDFNPQGLFHNLTRKTEENRAYQKQIGAVT